MNIYSHSFKTPYGMVSLAATAKGFYALDFGKANYGTHLKGPMPIKVQALFKKTEALIKAYFTGKDTRLTQLPIDWSGYNGFARQVLGELRRIPRGRTQSYQYLAQRAGKPRAMRYVGKILGSNRTPVIIPCHRILPKSGGLGGFSAGLAWKKRLLKLERAPVDTKSQVQTSRFDRH